MKYQSPLLALVSGHGFTLAGMYDKPRALITALWVIQGITRNVAEDISSFVQEFLTTGFYLCSPSARLILTLPLTWKCNSFNVWNCTVFITHV